MSDKLNRSLRGVLVATLLAAPAVHAVSDDVAVQLLDRLNELEGEVNNLRGENELLRDKLDDLPTRADELKQDGVLSEPEATDGSPAPRLRRPAPLVPGAIDLDSNPATTVPDAAIRETVEDVTHDAGTGAGDIPSLEELDAQLTPPEPLPALNEADATTKEKKAESNEDSADSADTADNDNDATANTADTADVPADADAAKPDDSADSSDSADSTDKSAEKAAEETPSDAAVTVVDTPSAKVDPTSTDSYYYYGTDKDKDKEKDDKSADVSANSSASTGSDEGAAGKTAAAEVISDGDSTDDGAEKKPESKEESATEHKAKADYNQAYKLLVNNPADAVPAFRAFMTNYPKHELVANAQYWLGEALYAQKDYTGASREFTKVLTQYKGSPKAPGAALKLGYSYYELKQWESARRTLEDTIRFFPDSNSAKLAQARLTRMLDEKH